MALSVHYGNVLDVSAGALVLTIDGAARGLEGNIARQFARRWPEAWEEIEYDIRYPLALGRVCVAEAHEVCPFPWVVVVSTLHHRETLSEVERKSVVRTAMEEAILDLPAAVDTLAAGVVTGGHRLPLVGAFVAMTEGYEAARRQRRAVHLKVCVLDEADARRLQGIAASLGFR